MYFICVIYYHFVALARSIPGLHVGSTIGTEMNYDFAPTK